VTQPAAAAEQNPGPDELRRRVLLRVLERLLRLRRLFAPALVGFALWVGLSDASTWRRVVLFVVAGLLTLLNVHDLLTLGRDSPRRGVTPNLAVIALGQHVMIFASGGMTSPVLPMILPIILLSGIIANPRLSWALALGIHLPALWIDAGVQLGGLLELTPTVFSGYGVPSPALVLAAAIIMSLAVVVTTVMSTTASAVITRTVGEALEARDVALASRTEQTRALTTLSGEIAHELKNPLASVKGLAALIERGELSGKSAERMQVLRREVDRMQGILEEFLNFSRPLVPLDQRELELRELVDHVVDLHEGVANERRVELRARGRAEARCDPRKVEQILINLVQNALEVAPPASAVELEIRREQQHAVITVRDAGPGLEPGLRGRVFEAGVTGKPEGSGLGLTIAQALARQHGGELELAERDGAPGCEATLLLPLTGVEDA
jgi:two-component system sensor histidine kinase HydH